MAFSLSKTTIRQRLVEWRNYKRLHVKHKERNQQLERQIKELKKANRQLRVQLAERDAFIEKLLLRVGDLEKMVFGEKQDNDRDSSSGSSSSGHGKGKKGKKRRPKDSFQRSIPSADEITAEEHHSLDACKHCGGPLTRIETVIRYVEDIILPQLLKQATKTAAKHIIERGYCRACGVWSAARDLRGQAVSLGQNVKLLVSYLITILDCSYEQVKTLTWDLYSLTLSDGEIVHILQEKAIAWQPEYEAIKEEIRAGPGAHQDETTWPIQAFAKHCYAWVLSAVNSPARIYLLATSRGKDHAIDLLGEVKDTFVRITDCYAVYKYLPGRHQICWAHLYRKVRDLKDNRRLPKKKQPQVTAWHDEFQQLYADLRAALDVPYHQTRRNRQEQRFRQRIQRLRVPHALDPKPLADLKNLLQEYDHALFTCLKFDGIPCDNNRAERDLRSLVIKRKKSFGSRTEQGAHALEILLSVAWTTWHRHRGNVLPELAKLSRTT